MPVNVQIGAYQDIAWYGQLGLIQYQAIAHKFRAHELCFRRRPMAELLDNRRQKRAEPVKHRITAKLSGRAEQDTDKRYGRGKYVAAYNA
jgi:hypothetical protein